MPSFDAAERSQRTSRRVVLYTITTSSATYRHTTHASNIAYAGDVYTAETVAHDDEQITQDPGGDELVIHLPISHPLVQRFAATGIPEQSVQVVVQELQTTASVAAMTWSGPGQSLTVNGHLAALRVPTATNDALKIQLPTVAAQKICNHVLFDGQCAPNPGGDWPDQDNLRHGGPVKLAFSATRQILNVSTDGLTIIMDSLGVVDQYFQYGTCSPVGIFGVAFAPESETRTIISQIGNVLTIDMPFVTSLPMVNAYLIAFAGCDHTVATCKAKFSNVTNFGGAPGMNGTINPWAPNGMGVIQQV